MVAANFFVRFVLALIAGYVLAGVGVITGLRIVFAPDASLSFWRGLLMVLGLVSLIGVVYQAFFIKESADVKRDGRVSFAGYACGFLVFLLL